jgi:hypothetical protein
VLCVCLMSLLVIIARITGPSKRVINDLSKLNKKRVLTREMVHTTTTCKADLKA